MLNTQSYLKPRISSISSENSINKSNGQLYDKIKSRQNNNSNHNIDDVFFDFGRFSLIMDCISNHKKSIIYQKNHSHRKSYIYCPLHIIIDIISQSIKGIGYLICTCISSLKSGSTIKRCLLYLIIFICLPDNSIQDLYRILTIFSPAILSKTQQRQWVKYNKNN